MGAKRALVGLLLFSTLPLAAAPFNRCRECVRLDTSAGAHGCKEWREFDCSRPDLGPAEPDPCEETVTRRSFRVDPDRRSTGDEATLRLVVPEDIRPGRYSTLSRLVIDIHPMRGTDQVPPGEHDMRFGPTPIPDCPTCPEPEPEGELVRISDTRCLPSSPGVRAWEGTVTTQAPAPRVEGLWRCVVETPDPDSPRGCGEEKR